MSYWRADPEDMSILDGRDDRKRAELIAERLRQLEVDQDRLRSAHGRRLDLLSATYPNVHPRGPTPFSCTDTRPRPSGGGERTRWKVPSLVFIGVGIAAGQKTVVEAPEPAMIRRRNNREDKSHHSDTADKTGRRNNPRGHSHMVRHCMANIPRIHTHLHILLFAPAFAMFSN